MGSLLWPIQGRGESLDTVHYSDFGSIGDGKTDDIDAKGMDRASQLPFSLYRGTLESIL